MTGAPNTTMTCATPVAVHGHPRLRWFRPTADPGDALPLCALVSWSGAQPGTPARRHASSGARARQLAGGGRGRPDRPGVGEPDHRPAAVLGSAPAAPGSKSGSGIDTATCHLSIGGWRIKTVPSRLTAADLARLRRTDGRPAGPPPACNLPRAHWPASSCVEVDRLVTASGAITLGNQLVLVGSPLAGQRARIRLDGQLMHVITQDGLLWRTLPCPSRPARGTGCKACAWPVPPPCPPEQRNAAGPLPRWYPGCLREDPGGHDQRGQNRHLVHIENDNFRLVIDGETVAGGAPYHQPGNAPVQGLRHPPGNGSDPMTPAPRPAEPTPGLAGLNVVRPRAPRCGRHVDPRHGTGVDWHLSGRPKPARYCKPDPEPAYHYCELNRRTIRWT